MWPTDILAFVVSAMDYCGSNGKPLPNDLVILWYVERHPCDDQPWLSYITFKPLTTSLFKEI